MKLDIIERSKQTLIATYSVPELSMLSFREWKDSLRIVIPLTKLPNVVTKLNSTDPETGDPSSVATSVDFYLPDPLKNKDAIRYERLTYSQVLNDDLKVMDTTAIVMCRDHDMPLYIFNLNNEGDLIRAVNGEKVGSIVERGE